MRSMRSGRATASLLEGRGSEEQTLERRESLTALGPRVVRVWVPEGPQLPQPRGISSFKNLPEHTLSAGSCHLPPRGPGLSSARKGPLVTSRPVLGQASSQAAVAFRVQGGGFQAAGGEFTSTTTTKSTQAFTGAPFSALLLAGDPPLTSALAFVLLPFERPLTWPAGAQGGAGGERRGGGAGALHPALRPRHPLPRLGFVPRAPLRPPCPHPQSRSPLLHRPRKGRHSRGCRKPRRPRGPALLGAEAGAPGGRVRRGARAGQRARRAARSWPRGRSWASPGATGRPRGPVSGCGPRGSQAQKPEEQCGATSAGPPLPAGRPPLAGPEEPTRPPAAGSVAGLLPAW